MTGTIATIPKYQFLDSLGVPLVNGTLTTYLTGTTTLTSTWQDQALSSLNTNPIVLDARGEATLWLDSSVVYKFVLKNEAGAVQWTQENISGNNSGSIILSADLVSTSGSSLVGFLQSGAGTVATTVQSELRRKVSPEQFGATANILLDDTNFMQAAISSNPSVLDLNGKTYRITAKLLFSSAGLEIRNGTLLFDGPITDRLVNITAAGVTFTKITFDGNSKQPRSALVYVDTDITDASFLNCTFKNIRCVNNGINVLNATYALLINPYGVKNYRVIDCVFKDITKYNDGVNGTPISAATVGLGFVGGICFLPEDLSAPTTAATTITSGIVSNCIFDNIQTIKAASLSIADQADFDDADAIRTYGVAGGVDTVNVHISNCIFRNVSKRAFKLRASGAVVSNCEIFADGMQYGMICPIDLTNNSKITNVKIFASSSKPVQSGVQWSIGFDYNRETLVQGLFVSHCISGVGFFSDPTNQPLRDLVLRDILINQATSYGIGQGSPLPSTMENIVIENVQIYGSGNNCRGIELAGAIDVTCGAKIKNVYIRNGSFAVGGVNNDIQDVQIEIDSSSYAGGAAAEVLFRIGVSGYGGYQHVENVFINAWNLNTAYVSATRTTLGNLLGDNANWKSIRIKVPDALIQTYPHCELWGNDWNLDGYTYDGPGFTSIATTVAGVRWAVKNAVRLGNGASSSAFLYTANSNTGNGLFENITDFRPTTNNTITINNGLGAGNRFIVTNVASKSSNGTLVQNGGLATVVNAILFP